MLLCVNKLIIILALTDPPLSLRVYCSHSESTILILIPLSSFWFHYPQSESTTLIESTIILLFFEGGSKLPSTWTCVGLTLSTLMNNFKVLQSTCKYIPQYLSTNTYVLGPMPAIFMAHAEPTILILNPLSSFWIHYPHFESTILILNPLSSFSVHYHLL